MGTELPRYLILVREIVQVLPIVEYKLVHQLRTGGYILRQVAPAAPPLIRAVYYRFQYCFETNKALVTIINGISYFLTQNISAKIEGYITHLAGQ